MAVREAVELPETLTGFAEAAVIRLGGLHPAVRVEIVGHCLWVEGDEAEAVRLAAGAFLHLLYQERIYAEGRAVRHALYAKLLAP